MKGTGCISALKALGDETRLRALRLLAERALSVGEISEALKVTPYNVSKHLRIMREAGLLECRKEGRQRLYAIPHRLRAEMSELGTLDLGCCTFKFELLPR